MTISTLTRPADELLDALAHRKMTAADLALELRMSVKEAVATLNDLRDRGLVVREVLGDPDARDVSQRPVAKWRAA